MCWRCAQFTCSFVMLIMRFIRLLWMQAHELMYWNFRAKNTLPFGAMCHINMMNVVAFNQSVYSVAAFKERRKWTDLVVFFNVCIRHAFTSLAKFRGQNKHNHRWNVLIICKFVWMLDLWILNDDMSVVFLSLTVPSFAYAMKRLKVESKFRRIEEPKIF